MSLPKKMAQELSDSKDEKIPSRRRWKFSALYLSDKQGLEYRSRSSSRSKRSVTVNRISPIFRSALAKLAIDYPSCVVVPSTGGYDEIVKAMATPPSTRPLLTPRRKVASSGAAAR